MKKKILFVFGTRPEAIKMAPLVIEFKKHSELFETIVCVTGQHREMLQQVLDIFQIVPDYDLKIMKQGQDLYDISSQIILLMRQVLDEVKPDLVFVHGDTTTSTMTALASFYAQVKVGHIEAGLRTHNIYSPWPEEMNRQITGRIATLHFAPTDVSRNNLLHEGISDDKIYVCGNSVIDALYLANERLEKDAEIQRKVISKLQHAGYDPTRLNDGERRLVLITGHRRENFGDGLLNVCRAIKILSEKYPTIDFLYPMHMNPNVRQPILEVFEGNPAENLFFIEPVEYLEFVYLMKRSYLILSDSGGIQEEAPSLGVPVLVMRDTTERPEAVEAGTVRLVGTSCDEITMQTSRLIDYPEEYIQMSSAKNPYGDGTTAQQVLAICDRILN